MHWSFRSFSGGAAQIRKGLNGILEEHHAEARDDPVGSGQLERVGLGVSVDEAGRDPFSVGPDTSGGNHGG